MNRHQRRKANKQERKFLPKDCMVTEIDLTDPNLAPEHRDNFIKAIRSRAAQLDEVITNWYRHRGECRIEGCDCGGEAIAEQVEIACSHLWFIKHTFGEAIVDRHPYFVRFLKDYAVDGLYEALTSSTHQ
jgi:hypothetical protein